jgi:hypothetical protein
MRSYGRVYTNGVPGPWQVVQTTPEGQDDLVWSTTLFQVLKLNLNESPFYGDWGIPAHPSIVQQVFPDYYIALTQQRFAPRFASLTISRASATKPTYNVAITTQQGLRVPASYPQ